MNRPIRTVAKAAQRIWDGIGPRGRVAVASLAYIVCALTPFPTTPINLALGVVIISNSTWAQRQIARYRQKNPERSERIVGKVVNNKFAPHALKRLAEETHPDRFFAKSQAEVPAFGEADRKAFLQSRREAHRGKIKQVKAAVTKPRKERVSPASLHTIKAGRGR